MDRLGIDGLGQPASVGAEAKIKNLSVSPFEGLTFHLYVVKFSAVCLPTTVSSVTSSYQLNK